MSSLTDEQRRYNAAIQAEIDQHERTRKGQNTTTSFIDFINDPATIEMAQRMPHVDAEQPQED